MCMLDGTHSVFHVDSVDDNLTARVVSGDVHPTGPLWGKGGIRVSEEVPALETQIVHAHAAFARGLEAAGLVQARRALRLFIRDLAWQATATHTLVLKFFLPAGAYATAVLRELLDTDNPHTEESNAYED